MAVFNCFDDRRQTRKYTNKTAESLDKHCVRSETSDVILLFEVCVYVHGGTFRIIRFVLLGTFDLVSSKAVCQSRRQIPELHHNNTTNPTLLQYSPDVTRSSLCIEVCSTAMESTN